MGHFRRLKRNCSTHNYYFCCPISSLLLIQRRECFTSRYDAYIICATLRRALVQWHLIVSLAECRAQEHAIRSEYVCLQPTVCLSSWPWTFCVHWQKLNLAPKKHLSWRLLHKANAGRTVGHSNMNQRPIVFVDKWLISYGSLTWSLNHNSLQFVS